MSADVPERDESVEVELEEPVEKPAALKLDESAKNMVDQFKGEAGERELKKLADTVLRLFEEAWSNSEEARDRYMSDWRIFEGRIPPKPAKYKDMANPHIPAMLENISRLQFRVTDEVFGDWSKVFGVIPTGPEWAEIAERMTRHDNWQIRNRIPSFKRQIGHRGVLLFYVTGDVVVHSYRDFERGLNCHDVLTPEQFVTPYVIVTTQPDFSDLPYYFQVLRLYKHQLQRYRGEWENVDAILKKEAPDWGDDPESKFSQEDAASKGIVLPEEKEALPYKLVWFEGWLTLPGSEDARFLKIIVDTVTRKVAHLSVHEEEDWQDRMRFDRQTEELAAYREAMAQWERVPEAKAAEEALIAQIQMGIAQSLPDEALAQLENQLMEIQANPLPTEPPPPPPWLEDPDDPEAAPAPVKRVPIRMYAHGVCIEPMTGSIGLAPGHVQAEMNRNMNIVMGQYIDAASLANSWSIITTDLISFEEAFAISPGKVNKATGVTGTDLDNNIKELKPAPASEQMRNFVRDMWGWAQSSVHAQDVMSGAPGKSGETYRGIATRREEAVKTLSVSARKYADFVTQVLKNNAKLNALFLPEEEEIQITDDGGDPSPMLVKREWYEGNYMVEMSSDMTFRTNAEKVMEADGVLAMIGSVPEMAAPGVALAFKYEALKRALVARGLSDMIPALGQPPPPDEVFGMPPMPPPPPPGAPGEVPPGEGPPPSMPPEQE